MTADWLQGLRGAGSGRNTWKAVVPDRLVPAPALWAGAPGARMHFSVGLLCGLHGGIHASTLAHSGRPETLFSEAFCRSKKWRMGDERPDIALAEREGFEPPIGLHLCRISSAVHFRPLVVATVTGIRRASKREGSDFSGGAVVCRFCRSTSGATWTNGMREFLLAIC
jgi:hypothetical protein